MADFEWLVPGGHQKIADMVHDGLDNKADTDGYYTQLTAGAADNLTARGDGVTASFLYRTTGGSASVPDDAEATVRSIKGRTLAWNQLVYNPDFSEVSGGGAVGFAASGASSQTYANGVATVVTNANYASFGTSSAYRCALVAGHKYLFAIDAKSSAGDSLSMFINSDGDSANRFCTGYVSMTADAWVSVRRIGECPVTSSIGSFLVQDPTGASGHTLQFRNPQLFDLTAMFGAGNEPTTVEEFTALYPLPYYPYDAGTLLPVRMTGVETTGFNQWDEKWENGYISDATGENVGSNTAYLRSKGYIPVFPGMAYNFTKVGNTGKSGKVYYYDADKAYLSFDDITLGSGDSTTPVNARYMRFWLNYSGTYNSDICVNLSWSGYRNGEYESYWSEQRIIAAIAENFPDGMREAGVVSDELTEHEAIHRVGEVDLGTLTWSKISTTGDHWRFTANLNTMAAGLDMTCAKYDVISASAQWQGANGISAQQSGSNYVVMVSDEAYADVAAFKAAMSGVMLDYALATPTTTPFDQPINMDYRFADFGTELILVPEGEMSAPPTMDVVYGLNAPDTLRTLPTEYVSKASDASFTAALGAFLNATITRTWNETNQRYDYTITANGGE